MKATKDKRSGKYRIIVPPSITGGSRQIRLFESKTKAEAEARDIKENGLNARAKIGSSDLALMSLIKNRYGGDPSELIRKLDFAEKMLEAVPPEKRLSIEQVCAIYVKEHEIEHNRRTVYKYRSTTNRLCADLGRNLPFVELTKDKIDLYLKRFKPGGNRLAQYRNVHAFCVWAAENKYIANSPLEGSKPKDKPKAHKEIVKLGDFRRILFACLQPRFYRLMPFFVLGGLAGIRRCEMISCTPAEVDPRIEWTDINWDKNQIKIRQEVAKETKAKDRRRNIPLEPTAFEWLHLAGIKESGPILDFSQSTLQREKAALLDMLGMDPIPENALRNSYASYGTACRSPGDVARAMGDLESTVRQYYVDLVDDKATGEAWFDIRPDAPAKIVQLPSAAPVSQFATN